MASRHVVATRKGNRTLEQRGLTGTNYGTAYAMADPHAIPPHGWQSTRRAGVLVTPKTMLQVDVVYTSLRIISNNIIKMGNLRAYTEQYDQQSGELYRKYLQTQPTILTDTFGGGNMGGRAGSMMQCTGMDRTIWSMALFGEAFWYILLRDKFERPSTVEVLHPAFMEVKVIREGPNKGQVKYIYGSGNDKVELDLDNLIHIPLKSLPGANRGLNPVEYAGVAAALAIAACEFGSSWFAQGASPSYILSTDQKLGQDEIARIAEKFLVEHSGLSQAHLPLVLDSGVKAEKALSTPDEAQFLETFEYSRQVIGSWFGIPPSKMPNALQRQPAAPPHVREEEAISFQQDTLSGYTVPVEEAYAGMLPTSTFAGFQENRLSKPDSQFQAQLLQALRITQTGSINDGRVRVMGWAPYEDPRADDPMAPLASNVTPSQTGSQSEKPPGSTAKPDDGPPASAAADK